MTIRDATEDDLPAIVAIYNEAIPGGLATADLVPVTVESRRAWFREFDPERRPCWVAEEDGEVVGCVYLRSFYAGRPAYDKTAEISTYLRASHQGRGVGTRLKEKMIAACPGLGVENVLSFYFDHNEASRRINRKLGFEDAAHLEGIAEVFGKKRGLVIAILRLGNGGRVSAGRSGFLCRALLFLNFQDRGIAFGDLLVRVPGSK